MVVTQTFSCSLAETMSNLISVIIPCYKMGLFIGDALASVGTQTFTDWEVIAVDDCGPDDGTRAVVDSFTLRFPSHRVEYIRHETNRGVSAARNTAIAAAKGEFLAFLDPDDLWAETYLEEHMRVLASDQSPAVSYTDARYVDESGAIMGGSWGPWGGDLDAWPDSLYRRNFINPSAAVARSRVIKEVGGFDETAAIQHVEDWDLWLRLVARGERFAYTPSAVEYYRKHTEAATSNMEKMAVRVRLLREKHLSGEDFKRFMAAYVTDLELKCVDLEAKLAQPILKRAVRRAIRDARGIGGRISGKLRELAGRSGR
jgi:glycosyltransferase involved in cell wall biosynthesis